MFVSDLLIFLVGSASDMILAPAAARSLGQGEGIAVNAVEAACDVAGNFQMLGLILPHGHEVGIVDEDVRCHQHGVGEQTAVDVVGVLGALILELGHARQLTKLRVAGQHPGKLGVRGHVALYKQNVLLRVDRLRPAAGRPAHGCGDAGLRALAHGQAVQVGHHVQAVVIGL